MAVRISKDDFDQNVLNAKLPVIVDFYTDSCIVCKKLSPLLGDAEDEYEGKLLVFKVNTSFDHEVAEKYSVMSNPTLIFFKSGEETGRKVGALSGEQLNSWIEENL